MAKREVATGVKAFKEWYTTAELADARLPEMPRSRASIEKTLLRLRGTAQARTREGRGGGYEYHYSGLPEAARAALMLSLPEDTLSREARSKLLWARFEALSDDHKQEARHRLDVLRQIDVLLARGKPLPLVIAAIRAKFGVARSSCFEWRALIKGVARPDWLAALAPKPTADGLLPTFTECHPDAWAALKSDYLRPEKPAFAACYRRVVAAAKKHGWAPIPHERSLRRRLESEVPHAVQVVAREGRKAAAKLYPPQVRSKAHLHAMEITNTDGHELDLFVQAPWSEKPVRVTLLGIQDIYSAKILSWRLAESETWDVVRACIGDMVELFGIPEHLYMDNGRAFSSKKISGGAKRRNRFKIDENEVAGLLTTLGIEPHFTKPYSGQSKPIERAWKDLAEEICKHPAMSGCYTGNKPDAKPENYRSKAVPLDVLQVHVADRIAEHNARTGRRSDTAKGRSFDETFRESMEHPSTIVRRATPAQRSLWLLSAEAVMARKPSGHIHYLGNIYWHPALNEWIGKKLTIRFDPDKMHEPVKIYDPAGRFICEAECREKVGFDTARKAGQHEKARRQLVKHNAAIADLHRIHSATELADIYEKGRQVAEKPAPIRPAITRIATGNLAAAEPIPMISDDEFEDNFSRGLALLSGDGGAVIPFPQGNKTGRRAGKRRAEM